MPLSTNQMVAPIVCVATIVSFVRSMRVLALVICLAILGMRPAPGFAQGQYPMPDYYALQSQNSALFEGDFRAAERVAQNLYRGGYREGNQRWVDSTAYLYLMGETRYQAGDYAGAMQAFDEAIEIYSAVIHWAARVERWDAQPITPDTNAIRIARITWGQPTRVPSIGRFPKSFSVRFGQDIIPQERIVPVNVIEMYRAMALVVRRRDQILGTLSQVDARARTLRGQLSEARSIVPGALPTTLGSILYGISVSGEGDYERSTGILQQYLQINGLDHPLTPVALLQIGWNQYLMGEYRLAKATLLEASYSAAFFNQLDLVRESLVLAGRAHVAVNRDQPLPELDLAFEWARVQGMRVAQVQYAMVAAENAIENGQNSVAAQYLDTASGLLRGADLKKSEIALRLNVLHQAFAAIEGRVDNLQPLRAALVAYRPATPWAFQIEMLVNPARRRNLTTTALTALIERVLRDPTQQDWDRDPFECLAYLTGDRSLFLADALTIHLNKRNFSEALVASENLRRVQFFSRLSLGGRLMSFRQLLTRTADELTPEMRRKQTELYGRFTNLKQSLDRAQAALVKLQTKPVAPPEAELKAWETEVAALTVLSAQIESQLVHVSVRRDAIPLLFPPPVDLERVQTLIPAKTLCLVVVHHNNIYHSFLVTKEKVVHQSALNQTDVAKAIRGLAKSWGHTSPSAVLDPRVVTDQTWKKASHQMFKAMIPNGTPEFWNSFDEVVVVPGGMFWYLPFETFALGETPESELLIDKVAVRYSPSLSLAFSDQRPKRLQRAVLYPGKIDLRDADDWAANSTTALRGAWPQLTTVEGGQVPTQAIGTLVNAMIYLHEIKQPLWPAPWSSPANKKDGYLQLDLERWIGYPNVGPEFLYVAGGNSAIVDGIKGNLFGEELEYYSTLLMASGCQSMVLPRWRSGGHVPYDLPVAVLKRMSESTTAVAMREAILEIRQAPLDVTRQTRLRSSRGEAPATADHPFWWAGQMVIDRGSWYREPDDAPAAEAGALQLGGNPPAEQADGANAAGGAEKPPGEGAAGEGGGEMPPVEQKPPGGEGPVGGEKPKEEKPGGNSGP
ncbi:MAG: hypothetical protein Q8M16_10745 [Pirellulaceae bacterium]|nr:hypothetical protein [Pirellulaceae bacterium]